MAVNGYRRDEYFNPLNPRDLYLYITWQYALLCYRATGVT